MANTTNFSVRMDSEVKYQCEELFGELGMNLTTAINVFLRQSIRVGGLPFEVKVDRPNKETIAAMREAERLAHDPNAKRYTDLDELFADLKA
jgi:DNA-damage-inducible protein J